MAGVAFVVIELVDNEMEVEGGDEGGGENAGGGTDNEDGEKD